jgi:hypothetical protein
VAWQGVPVSDPEEDRLEDALHAAVDAAQPLMEEWQTAYNSYTHGGSGNAAARAHIAHAEQQALFQRRQLRAQRDMTNSFRVLVSPFIDSTAYRCTNDIRLNGSPWRVRSYTRTMRMRSSSPARCWFPFVGVGSRPLGSNEGIVCTICSSSIR